MSDISPVSSQDRRSVRDAQVKGGILRTASAIHSVSKSLHECVMSLWSAFKECLHMNARLSLEDHLKREEMKEGMSRLESK